MRRPYRDRLYPSITTFSSPTRQACTIDRFISANNSSLDRGGSVWDVRVVCVLCWVWVVGGGGLLIIFLLMLFFVSNFFELKDNYVGNVFMIKYQVADDCEK